VSARPAQNRESAPDRPRQREIARAHELCCLQFAAMSNIVSPSRTVNGCWYTWPFAASEDLAAVMA